MVPISLPLPDYKDPNWTVFIIVNEVLHSLVGSVPVNNQEVNRLYFNLSRGILFYLDIPNANTANVMTVLNKVDSDCWGLDTVLDFYRSDLTVAKTQTIPIFCNATAEGNPIVDMIVEVNVLVTSANNINVYGLPYAFVYSSGSENSLNTLSV